MNGFRLPLILSLAAHAIILGLLVMLPAPIPPAAPSLPSGIEVAFAPSLPAPPPPPAPPPVKAEPPPPPPKTDTPRPVAPIEPPPPAPEAAVVVPEPLLLPPPPKPPVPPRRVAVRRVERPVTRPEEAPVAPVVPVAPAQQAALAPARVRPPASAAVSPGYQALLGEWLNSHKRYPEGAREHGEQGRAILHFAVERSGRVTEFAVVKSSGYPDLDQGLEEMMRGAILPPFPADMPQSSISVSVTIRFTLEQ
ncbi:MAG: energy transducer TonB [Alphaproteobacteria bacterium]|nr:energy transducer TonB [Alphaproteobacteria bacterium]